MLEGATDAGSRSEAVVHSTNVAVEANGEEEIIEVVIDQLGPSISSAVEAALASSSQDEALAKAEAEAQAKAEAAAAAAAEAEAAEAAAFEQEFNQFTSSAATKTTEGDLVGQVIAALTPSITDAVAAALAGQSQTTVTITQQAQAEAEAQAAAQKKQAIVQQVLAALTSQVEAAVMSAMS